MSIEDLTNLPSELITMAHGSGGKATRKLIEDIFTSAFQPDGLEDQARLSNTALNAPGVQLALTTDSFVVDPIEFPGGDIGKISVCGTVNDLAVGGAQPLWLSAAFILEEGCEIALLRRIVASMSKEAYLAGVRIVTGDTKVVGRGYADKVFITTSGVGIIPPQRRLNSENIRPGDVVIVNGVLGNHGATILASRDNLALSTNLVSDCASLGHLMEAALNAAPDLRTARDLTRGGLASALNEITHDTAFGIEIEEELVPLHQEVSGICEILGLDPLYLANEGRLVLFVPEDQAESTLKAMRSIEVGKGSRVIGRVVANHPGVVTIKTMYGGNRIVDTHIGEQLPRIC
ncbi:MAG: Carbamoyl dehydratase HypE [Hyphomicrobiaceae bacterium hypho_1]